eukprot:XP_015575483.1 17.6 kDa class I heat shock protein 1 [Ricinus communis]
MSMIPGGFNANTLFSSSSNFSNQFNITDPLSVTMYWQETAFVITANVQVFRTEDVRVEIRGRNVVLKIGGGRQNCGCIKSCQLPSNVNVDMTTTSINNGVLFVKVPTDENEPRKHNPPVVANAYRRRRSFFC